MHAASPARQPQCCSRADSSFPLHEPGISEELVILNRHGLTAKVARSYTLIAACLLLLAGVLALSVGPGALRPVAENTPQSPFAADTSAIRASYSRLPMIFEAN